MMSTGECGEGKFRESSVWEKSGFLQQKTNTYWCCLYVVFKWDYLCCTGKSECTWVVFKYLGFCIIILLNSSVCNNIYENNSRAPGTKQKPASRSDHRLQVDFIPLSSTLFLFLFFLDSLSIYCLRIPQTTLSQAQTFVLSSRPNHTWVIAARDFPRPSAFPLVFFSRNDCSLPNTQSRCPLPTINCHSFLSVLFLSCLCLMVKMATFMLYIFCTFKRLIML